MGTFTVTDRSYVYWHKYEKQNNKWDWENAHGIFYLKEKKYGNKIEKCVTCLLPAPEK